MTCADERSASLMERRDLSYIIALTCVRACVHHCISWNLHSSGSQTTISISDSPPSNSKATKPAELHAYAYW